MILRDALMAVVWMTVNLLARTSWRLAAALSPGRSFVDRLLDALVVGLSMIIAGAILLGTTGWLSGFNLLLAGCALATAGEWLTRRIVDSPLKNGELKNGDWLRRLRTFLSEFISPPVPVPLFQRAVSETPLTPLSEASLPTHRSATNWWGIVWSVLLAWLVSHMIVDGLLKFPTDWDCLMYHIPMVDEWLQARSLYAPDSSYWWSPGNSEVIGLWCVAPFSGDFLIALNNLPVMVLWVASTISVARSLGMSNTGSHFTALAVVLVHTSFHETDDASNDLLLVAAFTAAIAYLLRNLRQPRTAEVALGGLSLGLLAGVKYFSVGYVTLVVGAWGIAALLRGKRWNAWRELALLAALAIPCGAYWYVRNVVVSGSPFYPMGLSGESSAVGYPNVGTTSLWGNPDPVRWGLVLPSLWKMTGPIHMVAVITAPPILLILTSAAFWPFPNERRSAFERWRWPLLTALIAGCGVLILITPFAVEDQPGTLNHLHWAYTPVRYGLPFLTLAVLGFAVAIDRFACAVDRRMGEPTAPTTGASRRRIKYGFLGCTAGAIAWQASLRFRYASVELNIIDSFLVAFNFSLGFVVFSLFAARAPAFFRRLPASGGLVAAVAAVACVAFLSHRWHAEFNSHYDRYFRTTMFSELARHSGDAGRICVLDLRHYPFFGSARQSRVCRPRHLESREDLYAYLDARKITYVVTHNGRRWDFDLYRDAPNWLRSAPEMFQRRIHGASIALYIYGSLKMQSTDNTLTPAG